MSPDFWFAIGVGITLVGGIALWGIHHVDTRRARRLEEQGRQRRLARELRGSLSLAERPQNGDRS